MPILAPSDKIVVLFVDDLGWADTSVPMMDSEPESKSDFYQTPYLEALAARGMRFSIARVWRYIGGSKMGVG